MTKAKLYFTIGEPQEINDLEVPNLNVSGIVTATSFIGDGSGLTNVSVSGVNTSGTSAFINLTAQQLNISGISTLQTTTIIGGGTSTGTANQVFQVTGGAYVSGNLGVGHTNPTQKLDVVGNGNFTGIVTATTLSSGNVFVGTATSTGTFVT